MDFKLNHKLFIDPRVQLQTFQTDDGLIETYPLNSFTFEYFLYFELDFKYIYTHTTNTPNTFYSEINENLVYRNCKASSTSRAGLSSGFTFYESTAWRENKNQKTKIPLYLLTHTINYFNNVRWVFISKLSNSKPQSVSFVYSAAMWSEREMQDMFDVGFTSLRDTRRLLLEYKTSRGVLNWNYVPVGLPKYSTYFDLYYV